MINNEDKKLIVVRARKSSHNCAHKLVRRYKKSLPEIDGSVLRHVGRCRTSRRLESCSTTTNGAKILIGRK